MAIFSRLGRSFSNQAPTAGLNWHRRWNDFVQHPAGPLTIHFWAPTFKWTIVLAGLSDLYYRPPHQVSPRQQTVLLITGIIWTRWSTIIVPRNWNLAAVNSFMAAVAGVQLFRIWNESKGGEGIEQAPDIDDEVESAGRVVF